MANKNLHIKNKVFFRAQWWFHFLNPLKTYVLCSISKLPRVFWYIIVLFILSLCARMYPHVNKVNLCDIVLVGSVTKCSDFLEYFRLSRFFPMTRYSRKYRACQKECQLNKILIYVLHNITNYPLSISFCIGKLCCLQIMSRYK